MKGLWLTKSFRIITLSSLLCVAALNAGCKHHQARAIVAPKNQQINFPDISSIQNICFLSDTLEHTDASGGIVLSGLLFNIYSNQNSYSSCTATAYTDMVCSITDKTYTSTLPPNPSPVGGNLLSIAVGDDATGTAMLTCQ